MAMVRSPAFFKLTQVLFVQDVHKQHPYFINPIRTLQQEPQQALASFAPMLQQVSLHRLTS